MEQEPFAPGQLDLIASLTREMLAASPGVKEPDSLPPDAGVGCPLCLRRRALAVAFDCGHLACMGCAAQTRGNACHSCRAPVTYLVRLFT